MKVLVVDDETSYGKLVAAHLNDAGHDAVAVTSGNAAIRTLGEARFDAVVSDLRMVPIDGMEVLVRAREVNPDTEVVIMTAYGTVEKAVEAMRRGAADFLTKPFPLEELLLRLERVQEKRALRRENQTLRQELADSDRFREMVGASPALDEVRGLVAKVAPSDASVLILGESGVGKELVARMIHRASRRAARPFVVVHAAALPETLLESELFGYEKGAFTGATARKPGRLDSADGGTVFLDEIGDISPTLQVKLLRFLQERTFVRLGSAETVSVDCRIVAATNRNLQDEVRQNHFREDLYYRLAVFPIQVPALRERKADIKPLARHILRRLGLATEPNAEVLRCLTEYDWPGNIRELENVLERALILAAGEEIQVRHIQLPEVVLVGPGSAVASGARKSLPDVEREMLEDALRRAAGNKSKAAKVLGITRRMLYTKLEKFGIEFEEEQ
jgi:DNA-binding NtrC family response regulator